jgi:hypothetical protein
MVVEDDPVFEVHFRKVSANLEDESFERSITQPDGTEDGLCVATERNLKQLHNFVILFKNLTGFFHHPSRYENIGS